MKKKIIGTILIIAGILLIILSPFIVYKNRETVIGLVVWFAELPIAASIYSSFCLTIDLIGVVIAEIGIVFAFKK